MKIKMLNILCRFCVVNRKYFCLFSVLVKKAWKIVLIDYRNAEQIYDSKIH